MAIARREIVDDAARASRPSNARDAPAGVGARLRLERRAHVRHRSAQPAQHLREHVVGWRTAASPRRSAPARGGCRGGRRRAPARTASRSALPSAPRRRRRTSTTRPSSARRQSPPRRTVPRSRNRPISSPPSSCVRKPALLPQLERQPVSASCGACGATLALQIDASPASRSEQEIALRHRQHARRLARQQLAVGAHFVGLRIDVDLRQRSR